MNFMSCDGFISNKTVEFPSNMLEPSVATGRRISLQQNGHFLSNEINDLFNKMDTHAVPQCRTFLYSY